MSSGPSWRKLNPPGGAASSSCGEETPRSNSTPSIALTPAADAFPRCRRKRRAGTGSADRPRRATRPASGSRIQRATPRRPAAPSGRGSRRCGRRGRRWRRRRCRPAGWRARQGPPPAGPEGGPQGRRRQGRQERQGRSRPAHRNRRSQREAVELGRHARRRELGRELGLLVPALPVPQLEPLPCPTRDAALPRRGGTWCGSPANSGSARRVLRSSASSARPTSRRCMARMLVEPSATADSSAAMGSHSGAGRRAGTGSGRP